MKKEGLFSYFPKYTRKRFFQIVNAAPSVDAFWLNPKKYQQALAWNTEVFDSFLLWKNSIQEAHIEAQLHKEQIEVISFFCETFPKEFRQMPDPPSCIFVKGILPQNFTGAVAIVGTRNCSSYGKNVTASYIQTLSPSSVIISGLARGIDTVAHITALENNMVTVGVLSSGVQDASITPKQNMGLARKIIHQGGCLLSEYPPGTEIKPYHFPQRNRLIAALASSIVVTEAPKKSGALITAYLGADYNKDVYTIPHPITSELGKGCNELLLHGATPIISIEKNIKTPATPLSEIEAFVLSHINEITAGKPVASQYLPEQILQTITLLEMKKVISRNPDHTFSRTFF